MRIKMIIKIFQVSGDRNVIKKLNHAFMEIIII